MRMPVVHVGKMAVRVNEWLVSMCMHVRLASVPRKTVCMPVMVVVGVCVRMFLEVMRVQMAMMLGQMQPYAHRHHRARGKQLPGYRLIL